MNGKPALQHGGPSYSMLPSGPQGAPTGPSAGMGGGRGPVPFDLQANKSPIDAGFPNTEDFDRGVIEFRQGVSDSVLDLSSLQGPLTFGKKLCSLTGMLVATGTLVGVFYIAAKVTLVRKGEIGIVEHIDGTLRALEPGFHIIETIGTRVHKASLADDFISQGALKIIRVLPQNVGLGTQNGRPVILLPGRHLIIDPVFVFHRQEPLTNPQISLGTVSLIQVQQGQVGLATVESTAHFLEPGRHNINSRTFAFHGFRPSTSEHINIGSKHRICVPAGKIGLGWERGAPLLLEPGQIYNIDSPVFAYAGSRALTEPVITHGSMTLVTVKQGAVGVSFEDGALTILPPGRHVLTKATHFFSGFLNMGQTVMGISEIYSMTSDNLGIKFDAAITVRVVDPKLAVSMLCPMDNDNRFDARTLFATVVAKAKLSLSIIIGNSRLNRVFRSTTRANGPAKQFESDQVLDAQPELPSSGASSRPTAPAAASAVPSKYQHPSEDPEDSSSMSFKQNVHDVFMAAFHESMLSQCGVEVVDMSIEDITIVNPELAHAMAQGAVARTNLLKAQIDMEVMRSKATAEQTSEIIRAEGRAKATAIIATAEADRIRKLDEAMSSVSGITAQRELIKAAGEVLSESKSSVVLASSIGDVTNLLGNGTGIVGTGLGLNRNTNRMA